MPKGDKAAKHAAIPVYFATNRDLLADGFAMDAGADARRLRLGRVEVEAIGDPLKTEAKRELVSTPATTGDDDFGNPESGSCAGTLDAWLAEAAKNEAVALLFIHGFGNSFGDAMRRAAQIAEFYAGEGLKLAPLAFSWPSDGKVLTVDATGNLVEGALRQYRADQDDATAAGAALARLLAEIRRARARQGAAARKGLRLCLLAHSMGNHALASGLLSLDNGLMTKEMHGLFDDAVMACADVSAASFAPGKSLTLLAELAGRVTVGISYDSTLCVASEIANGNRRLGHAGPEDLSVLAANVEVVDYWPGLDAATRERVLATGGSDWDTVQHQWYRNDANARADLALVLAGKKPKGRKALGKDKQTEGRRTRHSCLA